MKVQGAIYAHGPHALQGPHQATKAGAKQHVSQQPVDQLDISREAQDLSESRESSGVRRELVDRVRAEIAAGTYDTEEKFNLAVDALAADLGVE
ncbi:MAG: flagellar biosynthesis anti-sigma factor FlgM [Planctomycetes bacterium]|nr:flagellar biosynthesis anti-sigma factor FlgM [Planctomycetota bacterium]